MSATPSPECWERFNIVRGRLSCFHGLFPYKTVPSNEGGIFAAYRNPLNANVLRIEVDNELDVVAVVSDGQSILSSGLLDGDESEREIVASFRGLKS